MDPFTKKMFSRNIKLAREKLGQTQREFAATIGFTPTTVCGWEKCSSFPSEKALARIVNTHRIRREYLLSGEGDVF